MSPVVLNPVAEWGTLVVETDIDRLVLTQLRTWLPDYLTQAEKERGLPHNLLARPVPGSFQNTLEDDSFPDGQLPAILVTTAKLDGEVSKGVDEEGLDRWAVGFRVHTSVVVRGRTGPETREVAAVFGGLVRRILLHKQLVIHEPNPELLLVDAEVWLAPGGGVLPVEDTTKADRWLAAGSSEFVVFVDEAVSGIGPVLPSEQNPYPDPDPGDPDGVYDPLATVREGGVTTTITSRS